MLHFVHTLVAIPMASQQFQAKFQDKVTRLGRLGELDLSHSKPISQERYKGITQFQQAATDLLRLSASNAAPRRSIERDAMPIFAKPIKIVKNTGTGLPRSVGRLETPQKGQIKPQSEPSSLRLIRSQDYSQAQYPPDRTTDRVRVEGNVSRQGDYVPYSLEDYRKIRLRRWVMLGGLGPRSQENEDWKRSHLIHKRRVAYAHKLKHLPLL